MWFLPTISQQWTSFVILLGILKRNRFWCSVPKKTVEAIDQWSQNHELVWFCSVLFNQSQKLCAEGAIFGKDWFSNVTLECASTKEKTNICIANTKIIFKTRHMVKILVACLHGNECLQFLWKVTSVCHKKVGSVLDLLSNGTAMTLNFQLLMQQKARNAIQDKCPDKLSVFSGNQLTTIGEMAGWVSGDCQNRSQVILPVQEAMDFRCCFCWCCCWWLG